MHFADILNFFKIRLIFVLPSLVLLCSNVQIYTLIPLVSFYVNGLGCSTNFFHVRLVICILYVLPSIVK